MGVADVVEEILAACRSMAGLPYDGEPVDQLQHALQAAALARQENADDELLVAALLHDVARAPAVAGVTPDMELVATETFGPVAPVIRVRDLDDAIAVANATPYGLSSGICTFDWRAIARCVRELRCGTVNVREVPGYRTELTPFGGVGDSGLGVKEGVREAIRAMSFTKLYTLPWT